MMKSSSVKLEELFEVARELVMKGINPKADRLAIRDAKKAFEIVLEQHSIATKGFNEIEGVFKERIMNGVLGFSYFPEFENKAIVFNYCVSWIKEMLSSSYDHEIRNEEREKEIDNLVVGFNTISGGEILKKLNNNNVIDYVLKDIKVKHEFVEKVWGMLVGTLNQE